MQNKILSLCQTIVLATAVCLGGSGAAGATGAGGAVLRSVVVADATTHEPIAQASLYSKDSGKFRAATTRDNGVATIDFAFQRLTVSHLNYERRVLSSFGDTIFLKPRFRQTQEVVVVNQEPAWIRPFLRRFAKTKDYRYCARTLPLAYHYTTHSIASHSYYRFDSYGTLHQRWDKARRYGLEQDSAVIVSEDTTSLTDMANLRRMLYEDFVRELDGDFISEHTFRENGDFKGRSANEIEVVFRAKSRNDDRGRMVVDTARCVVLSAWRRCGTKSNLHRHMPQMLYMMARAISGYRIDTWNTDYSVTYGMASDGQLFPAAVRLKHFYAGFDSSDDQSEREYNEQTGNGFPNMESTLSMKALRGAAAPDSQQVHQLPFSWYIRLSSEAERRQEIELSHLPARFEILGNTDF